MVRQSIKVRLNSAGEEKKGRKEGGKEGEGRKEGGRKRPTSAVRREKLHMLPRNKMTVAIARSRMNRLERFSRNGRQEVT